MQQRNGGRLTHVQRTELKNRILTGLRAGFSHRKIARIAGTTPRTVKRMETEMIRDCIDTRADQRHPKSE